MFTAEVLAVLISAWIGSRFYNRQLVTRAKIDANKELSDRIKNLRDKTNECSSLLRSSLKKIADMGDKMAALPSKPSKPQIDEATQQINEKFEELRKLVDKAYELKTNLLNLMEELTQNPLLPRNLRTAVSAKA